MQSGFPCLSALLVLVISLHSLDCVVALDIGSKRSVPMSSSLEAFGGLKGLRIDLSDTGGTPGLDACMQAPTEEELLLQRLLQEDVDEVQRRKAAAPKHMPVQKSTPPLPQPLPPTPSPSLLWLNKGKVLKWWLSFADRVIAASQFETRNNLVEAFKNISDHEKKSKWRPIIEKICGNHLSRSTLVPSRIAKSESSHPTMSSGKINVSLLKKSDGCAVVHHI